jgi:hypothetical protein
VCVRERESEKERDLGDKSREDDVILIVHVQPHDVHSDDGPACERGNGSSRSRSA